MLAHLKRHVVEHRQIGKQRAKLKHHAQTPAHFVDAGLIQIVDELSADPHLALSGFHHAGHQAQQGGLAGAADPHDGDRAAARDRHIDTGEYRASAVGVAYILDFYEIIVRHHAYRDHDSRE